jgi:glycosyltransferase involved in cell wall biosynthesis
LGDLKFSICLPTFNSGDRIGVTLKDILDQSYQNYEVIVSDNASTDDTAEVVASFNDRRIKYFRNGQNMGYAQNLNICAERSSGDILFLMSAKSRLSQNALKDTFNAFMLSEDVGAVTRPYYWFGRTVDEPVRIKAKPKGDKDLVVSVQDNYDAVIDLFKTVDNPAGLAFRRKFMDRPFHPDPFVEFVYPFASILKKHKVVFLNHYTMACPALTYSGSQNPHVYKKSPMRCWIDLFETVFGEDEFKGLRKACIERFVAVNYVGLAQIKNYAGMKALLNEIGILIKVRPLNLLSLRFWLFSFGAIAVPGFILKKLVRIFKKEINSKLYHDVKLGA